MRWTLAALLGSALVAHQALAELSFTVTATRKGVPVPKSEIKLEPFEFGRSRIGHATQVGSPNRRTRRSNTQANSANWCGSVNTTPSTNQIKVIHAAFQHPACTKRTGVNTYPQAAANWIGIDGDSYTSALLQSGTVCKVCRGGRHVYPNSLCCWTETNTSVSLRRLTTPPASSGLSSPLRGEPADR